MTAYVMTVTGFGWEDALRTVRAGRPCANPNLGFQRQLQSFDKHEVHQVTVPGPWADASGVLYTPAAWSLAVERTGWTSGPSMPLPPLPCHSPIEVITCPLLTSRSHSTLPFTIFLEPRVGFCFFPFGSRAVSLAFTSSGQNIEEAGLTLAGQPQSCLFPSLCEAICIIK